MTTCSLILLALLAGIEPLTPQEALQVAGAYDGTDHLDEAFEALAANARRWTPGIGDALVRLHPDLDAMGKDPGAYRGDLCRIEGRLEQRRTLETHEGVQEWFVRDAGGTPALVFLVGAGDDAQEGAEVVVVARFYKRLDVVARDGRRRGYTAFVGANAAPATAPAWGVMTPVLIPVLIMFVVFFALLIYARRGGPTRRIRDAEGQGEHLPGDAADAMAELRRRADAAP